MKLEFSRQIFEKYTSIKFHENPSSGRRVVPCGQMDGQTDMTKLIAAFRNFRTRLKTALPTECSPTNPVANQFTEWYAIARLLHDDFFYHGATAQVGQGLPIIKDSRSYSDTPHSVGLLWTRDHPRRGDNYLTTHNTHFRQISTPPAGFEPTIPASERPQTHVLRPRGHWDRHKMIYSPWKVIAAAKSVNYGALIIQHKINMWTGSESPLTECDVTLL
jgi:hypothetical protein